MRPEHIRDRRIAIHDLEENPDVNPEGVTLETPSIFASLMLIALLGLALYGVVVLAEQLVAPWAQREDAAN